MNRITVREYDYLISKAEGLTEPIREGKGHIIPKSAFEYLNRLMSQGEEKEQSDSVSLFLKRSSCSHKPAFQLQNYVGVLQTPCGTQIEILPKITEITEKSTEQSRIMLFQMLRYLRNSPFKRAGKVHLRHAPMHLLECFIACFLEDVSALVKHGIRSDYVSREENQAFLKAKLLIHKHIRHNAVQQQRFFVAHDEYLPDRPENRLIRCTLEKVCKLTRSAKNQRLNRELLFVFDEIPHSKDIHKDLSLCKTDRAMAHYQHSLEWCRLILENQSIVSSMGKKQSLSLLFPMEKIFENYVSALFQKNLSPDYQITTQAGQKYLCVNPNTFQLRPDILIKKGDTTCWIADAKWKRINDGDGNSGISQSDMYQLYAYGKKYNCSGLFLIYPKTEAFKKTLEFEFESALPLKCIPFDCHTQTQGEEFFKNITNSL